MNENHRELISITFTMTVILLACVIAFHFLIPLAWAGIIAIASWPFYKRLNIIFPHHKTLVATILTSAFVLVVVAPLLWLTKIAVQEIGTGVNFLLTANTEGMPAPEWLGHIPWFGEHLPALWQETLGKPQGLTEFFAVGSVSLKAVGDFAKLIGFQLAHRTIIFGFAIVSLFFFYRDGEVLAKQIKILGRFLLRSRWKLYSTQLPVAIKATVNGLVLVGISVGIILGVCYAVAGVPFAGLFGLFTAVFAMIPFGAPVVFSIVSLILLIQGKFISALVILIIGGVVMFVADHFVRPVMIGGATRMHFLAVLFGILGGVETLGLVGLFIGPVIMVLFTTLWHEPEMAKL